MMSALVLAGVMFIFLGSAVQDLSPASHNYTGTIASVKGCLLYLLAKAVVVTAPTPYLHQ